jgi:hypothetical protein
MSAAEYRVGKRFGEKLMGIVADHREEHHRAAQRKETA